MIFDRVFEIFYEICSMPHGSGNSEYISKYCVEFAKKNNLDFYSDSAGNVIIYKPQNCDRKQCQPIILQGHTDMVCQKADGVKIDFENEGVKTVVDGDYIKASGTTLGADNGIAVAMILAILESNDLKHPPIEAVLTTDEEIGMVGAGKLDFSHISAHRMINLDAESPDVITVSCAGGCDVVLKFHANKIKVNGSSVKIKLSGLMGGHSGIEIGKGRINATILLANMLKKAFERAPFNLISINGGEKRNAIPTDCIAEVAVQDYHEFISVIKQIINETEQEVLCCEPGMDIKAYEPVEGEFSAFSVEATGNIIKILTTAPDGVQAMSKDVEQLVETSLNMGVVSVIGERMEIAFLLRSNKKSSLDNLILNLKAFASLNGCNAQESGFYPPWEYKADSQLRLIYKDVYKKKIGKEPLEEAIHAGMECGVFAEKISDFDCISFGPVMHDIHTVNERLSITSTKQTTDILINLLNELC